MVDGVLFDLDGTLWNAVPEQVITWNQVMTEEGVDREPLTADDLQPCMGKLLGDIAEILFPELSRERKLAVVERCCRAEEVYLARHGAALYPGEEKVLEQLSGRCPLFVVSNCQDGYIQSFYAGTGLGKYFSGFECAGRTGRPKSENIALVVERCGLKAPVYVGDTALDCQSARQAGVSFIHAAYGFGKVEGAMAIQSMEELPGLLERL